MTEIMQRWKDMPPAAPVISKEAAALVDRVNERRRLGVQAGEEVHVTALRMLNYTREVGLLIAQMKDELSETQFQLAQGQFEFDARHTQGFLEVARRHPQPITDVREAVKSIYPAQLALGLVEFPEGHGPQTLHDYNFALAFTKKVTALRTEIYKGLEKLPIGDWSPEYARQFVAQSDKAVTDINRIVSEARGRAELAA